MDFLPPPIPKARSTANKLVKIRPHSKSMHYGEVETRPANLAKNVGSRPFIVWLLFMPTMVFIVFLASATAIGKIDGRFVAYAIGFALVMHNLGAMGHSFTRRLAPDFARATMATRVLLPIVGAGVVHFLIQPVETENYLQSLTNTSLVAAALVAAAGAITFAIANLIGSRWIIVIRITCCVYMAIILISSFWFKFSAFAPRIDALLVALVLGTMAIFFVAREAAAMPLQIGSLVYSTALWSSDGDPEGVLLGVKLLLGLLFMLLIPVIGFVVMLQIAKNE